MSRVYIVQNALRKDEGGTLRPKYNFNPATEYGQLVYLLGPSASPFHPHSYLGELQAKLRNFGDNDFLICVGNPILLAVAATIAADANEGRVRFLQWSGEDRKYLEVDVNGIFPPDTK